MELAGMSFVVTYRYLNFIFDAKSEKNTKMVSFEILRFKYKQKTFFFLSEKKNLAFSIVRLGLGACCRVGRRRLEIE